jgi:BCD family chlorophyll transporter-like MFS transporter
MNHGRLSWIGIARLGLVQAALGSVVVLVTSVMNRVAVVELALPAVVPGVLIALHYALQLLRPKFGHGSDRGGRRTPWIVAGMALLAGGAVLASFAIAVAAHDRAIGLLLAVLAFSSIGLGVGAAGTSLLTLLADRCDASRRPAAATLVWLMMIAGFVLTTLVAGHFLDPFSYAQLIRIALVVSCIAMLIALVALWRIEPDHDDRPSAPQALKQSFWAALQEVWAEPHARRFAIFIFVSMLAYSSEELALDPFSAFVFGYTPGQSTQLSGSLHAGVFCGMLLVGLTASLSTRHRLLSLQSWMVIGCLASAASLAGLAAEALQLVVLPLRQMVLALGVANGTFAVAAIGSMMQFANQGANGRQGTRMGVWGAAQGVAFGLGGVLASLVSDLARSLFDSVSSSYALVFCAEAVLFALAARIALLLVRQQLAVGGRAQPRQPSMLALKADL